MLPRNPFSILPFLLLPSFPTFGQNMVVNLGLQIQELEVATTREGYKYSYVSPTIGLQRHFNESNAIRVNFLFNHGTRPIGPFEDVFDNSTFGSNATYQFELGYQRTLPFAQEKAILGIGFFQKKSFSTDYFLANNSVPFVHGGFVLSAGLTVDKTEIRFVKFVDVYGDIQVLERHLNAISVTRSIKLGKDEETETKTSSPLQGKLKAVVSLSVSPNKYFSQDKFVFNPQAVYFGAGLSYSLASKLSFSIHRHVWKRIVGGTLSNDVVGLTSVSDFVFRYKFSRRFGFAVGWHPIRVANEPPIIEGEFDPNLGIYLSVDKVRYTNVYGTSLGSSFYLNDRFSIELRKIFPYKGDKFISPQFLNLACHYIL